MGPAVLALRLSGFTLAAAPLHSEVYGDMAAYFDTQMFSCYSWLSQYFNLQWCSSVRCLSFFFSVGLILPNSSAHISLIFSVVSE